MIELILATVLLGAASYRVWRIFGKDVITELFRERLAGRNTWMSNFVLDGIECPWCLGWWVNVAGAVSLGLLYGWHPLEMVLVMCAGSWVTATLGSLDN